MKRHGKKVTAVMTGCLLSCVLGLAQASEPVVEALMRPAIQVSEPARAFLVDAEVAGDNIIAVGERGLILLSTDEGRSWRQSQVPVSTGLTAVHFIDAQHGMAVGHGGVVLGTRDAGESWHLLLDGRQAAQLALASAKQQDDEHGVVEAQRLIEDGPDKPFLDVLMFSPERVLVVGAYGLAFLSEDAGATWSPVMQRMDNPQMLHFYAIRQQGQRILLVGEQGLLNLSEDGGINFQQIDSPYEGSFFTAELERDGGLVIAGLRGNVYRSRNAGRDWRQLDNPVTASITSSRQLANGEILLASQAGVLLQVTNTGVVPVSKDRLPPLNAFVPTPEDMLLLTVDGIRRSAIAR